MRQTLLLVFVLLIAPNFTRADAPATQPTSTENWKLVWSDDFQYTGLPDPTKWGYEDGFVRNKEPQYYTTARIENAHVDNGLLTIEARKEAFPNAHFKPGSSQPQMAEFTSASLTTKGLFDWKYGRFVCCAKIPGSRGCWPAFWMLGANHDIVKWPNCGEIDTMEFFSQRTAVVKGSVLFINAKGKFQSVSKDHKTTPAPADDFHTYEARWYPDRIDLYVDDEKYNTMHIDDAGLGENNPFRKPFYLILNLAMGSTSGKIDDSQLPAKYQIKYVHVYQLDGQKN